MASSPIPKAPPKGSTFSDEAVAQRKAQKPVEASTKDLPKDTPTPPPTPTKTTTKVPTVSTSTGDATGTVVTCVIVIIGSALVKDVYHGNPSIRPVVTGMMLGGVLLILATFAPTLAKMLAVIGMVGALMTNGAELTQVAGKVGAKSQVT